MTLPQKLRGHIDLGVLSSTALNSPKAIATAPSDSPQAFVEAATNWIARWIKKHGPALASQQAPFAMVYAERSMVAGDPSLLVRELVFDRAVELDVGGKIVVSTTTLANVSTRKVKAQTLNDLANDLLAMNVHRFPSVLVHPGSNEMLLCADGLEKTQMSMPLIAPALNIFSLASIDAQLAQFNTLCSQYPETVGQVWAAPAKRILRRDAVAILRSQLVLFLKYSSQNTELMVREEPVSESRTSISIYKPGQTYERACVMDIQILRSSTFGKGVHAETEKPLAPKVIIKHARTAVMRLVRDRTRVGATFAYLCFYDGRKAKQDVQEVETLATANDVQYPPESD